MVKQLELKASGSEFNFSMQDTQENKTGTYCEWTSNTFKLQSQMQSRSITIKTGINAEIHTTS